MKRIRHTGITVTSLEPALVFYRDLLGLKVVKDFVEEGTYIDTLSGFGSIKLRMVKLVDDYGSMIELLQYLSHPEIVTGHRMLCAVGISHMAFEVDDLDETYERLVRLGVPFNSIPCVSPDSYAKVVFCRDPDGNLVELVQVL